MGASAAAEAEKVSSPLRSDFRLSSKHLQLQPTVFQHYLVSDLIFSDPLRSAPI